MIANRWILIHLFLSAYHVLCIQKEVNNCMKLWLTIDKVATSFVFLILFDWSFLILNNNVSSPTKDRQGSSISESLSVFLNPSRLLLIKKKLQLIP